MSAWPQNNEVASLDAHAQALFVRETAGIFMAKVYRWMTFGLGTTALVAWLTVHNEALLGFVMRNFWLVALSPLAFVIVLSFTAHKLSGPVAATLFLVYSAVMGLSLSTIFLIYQLGTIFGAFAITATAFLALSVYGTVTKRDLSAWRSFLFIGLIGVIVAGVVNIFMRSGPMGFVISCATVVVFAGLTAYDTQKLRQIHATSSHRSMTSLAVMGALTLYLDFINLFLAILRIFGRRD
jgi:FtsH-binding integral membrane protein